MALKHQQLCLEDCLVAQREVNSHLVAIEVGVERSTCQRVQLNCLTLDKFRLECLNTQTVKCRSTVEEYRVSLHYVLKDVPYNWFTTIDNLLCRLHSLHDTALNELANDEWLVELCCHKFW